MGQPSACTATQGVAHSSRAFCRVPLDKREGSVKGKVILCGAGAPLRLPEKVEDQGSGNLTLNHLPVVKDADRDDSHIPHLDQTFSQKGDAALAAGEKATDHSSG